MSAIRPATTGQRHYLGAVGFHLRQALLNAKCANSPKLQAKIRSAIKSLGGAERHLEHRIWRTKA